jgi:hypothetical protein
MCNRSTPKTAGVTAQPYAKNIIDASPFSSIEHAAMCNVIRV